MKAITLTQPWATLVVLGLKRWETRGWSTNYRGPLGIHAAKGYPRQAREFAKQLADEGLIPHELPLGAIIGRANLSECWSTDVLTGRRGLRGELVPPFIGSPEQRFGDYGEGRYAFRLLDAEQFPEPIPAKGALGLWSFDMDYWREQCR